MRKENKGSAKLHCNNQKTISFIETMTFIEKKKAKIKIIGSSIECDLQLVGGQWVPEHIILV